MADFPSVTLPPGFGAKNDLPALLAVNRRDLDPLVEPLMRAVLDNVVPNVKCKSGAGDGCELAWVFKGCLFAYRRGNLSAL